MRAIGYLAPCQLSDSETEDNIDRPFSWTYTARSSAVSWGDTQRLSRAYFELPSDPVEQIVNYCQEFGHHLVAIFGVDGGTDHLYATWGNNNKERTLACDPSADQFTKLLQALGGENGQPALVVVPDASHLADDLETLVRRLLSIRTTGSETICTDPELPDPLQNGEGILGMRGDSYVAQNRIRARVIEKASQGKVLGRTPYGYRCNAEGSLEPIPSEAKVVQQIFRWYAGDVNADSERHEDNPPKIAHVGMRLIAQRLIDAGIPTRTGKDWSPSSISIILRNRVYLGTYSRYGFLIAGSHQPIISLSLFRRAQKALAHKHKKQEQSTAGPPFFLGGLLKCHTCRHSIPGMTRRRKWKRNDGSIASKVYRYYEYYECPNRRKSIHAASEQIKCPVWHAKELDSRVRSQIADWSDSIISNIKPRTLELSSEQQLADAEKTFLHEASIVSTGRGDLENLGPFLDEIDRIRTRIEQAALQRSSHPSTYAKSGKSIPQKVTSLVSDALHSTDPLQAHQSLASIVEEVLVYDSDVTVVPYGERKNAA